MNIILKTIPKSLLEQIRTIDKKRIRHYVGKLSGKDMEQVERCLAVSLDLKII